ncbi:MAG: flippase-like domain-containing protein [Thermoplasmatota archaeon]
MKKTNQKKQSKKKNVKISIILSIALSVVIIFLIFLFSFDASSLEYFSTVSVRYEFFVLAGLLNIITWIIWGIRLKVLSNAISDKVSISTWKSIRIVITNLFLASITPSMAGGEPVRVYLLNKEGLSYGSATASVISERLIDAVVILFLVPVAFYIMKEAIDVFFIQVALLIGVIFFIGVVLLFFYAIKRPEKTKSFLLFLNRKICRFFKKDMKKQSRIIDRINTEVDNFHEGMMIFLEKNKKPFLIAGMLTIMYWSVGFLIPSMLLLGLGMKPIFIESFAAQVLLVTIIMMPTTPGSSGTTELGVGGLYTLLIGSSIIGVFVLLFRLITYHMNLIAGAIFQYRIFKSVASFSLETIKKKQK